MADVPDPHQIWLLAMTFERAAGRVDDDDPGSVVDPFQGASASREYLESKLQDGTGRHHEMAPAMVLDTFSLELYLKCLIVIDKGCEPPHEHRLTMLFNELTEPMRTRLRDRYDQSTSIRQARAAIAQIMQTLGEPALDLSLDGSLAHSFDLFVYWRYFFERAPGSHRYFSAVYVRQVLKEVILELRPGWRT